MTYRRLLPLLLASACVAPGESETTSTVINARTVISLTFDDTLADQFQVGDIAAARGMRAVFYINGPRVGAPGYMTKAQVLALAQAGHEIGGHTLSHENLPTLSPDDARNQICNDRVNLLNQGFRVTSFAYPFGADNSSVQSIVEECGYNSGRDVGGLKSAGLCPGCPWTNPVPPANLYMVRTNDSIQTDTTLATMQQYVLDAENNGGGYVPFVFHHVCDACDSNAVTTTQLADFLDWLAQRGPNTQVGTVDEEIGGEVEPPVSFPSSAPANLVKNPSLETDANNDQVPDCWQRGGYGTNAATYSLVTDAVDGSRAQRIDVTSLTSGGRRLVTAQDSGACAPAATVGHRYTVTASYKANVAPRFTAYYRNATGSWVYLSESASLPTSTSYRQATYTTPALPSGATAISVGLTIYAVGTITMDGYSLTDLDGTTTQPPDTTAPSITISCNGRICSPSPYAAPVSVSLAGWDFSGIRDIRYTTNGSDPAASGTVYTAPFVVNATTTVRAIGRDNANNSITLTKVIPFNATDTTPPALSIACNGATCASTTYAAPVSISLAASDASGIRQIRYTTNGSDPATGIVYTGPFTVSATTNVRAIATDNANNATTLSRTIQVAAADTTPPALAITCNGTACSAAPYSAPVSVVLTSSDASGIREVRYTLDGSDPATGTLYAGTFTVSTTTTVRVIATDNANNATTLSQTIQVAPPSDTTPPALSIACNGAACQSTYSAPVSIALAATDASGIAEIRYTLDGSDPAAGALYTAPFTVSSSATVRATAVDNAGNRSSLAQAITIGQAPPANLLQNASLELDSNGDQVPDCWQRGGYGTNAATFSLVADAFDGAVAQTVTITSFSSGGRRLVSLQDSGSCAPAVTVGRRYTMSVYYKANVAPRFSVYYRTASGSWVWFAESGALPTSSTYRQATYTTPAMPADATAISIGLSIFGIGSVTSDAYTLVEAP